jgi:hypothetical protein
MIGLGGRLGPGWKNARRDGVFAGFSAVSRVFWVAFSHLSILIIPSCRRTDASFFIFIHEGGTINHGESRSSRRNYPQAGAHQE